MNHILTRSLRAKASPPIAFNAAFTRSIRTKAGRSCHPTPMLSSSDSASSPLVEILLQSIAKDLRESKIIAARIKHRIQHDMAFRTDWDCIQHNMATRTDFDLLRADINHHHARMSKLLNKERERERRSFIMEQISLVVPAVFALGSWFTLGWWIRNLHDKATFGLSRASSGTGSAGGEA